MNPETITEQLMYSTVLIETADGRGTGFFFNFFYENDIVVPIIITNKHVINNHNSENVRITLHTKDKNGSIGNNVVFNGMVGWNFHTNKDLCFCYAIPIIGAVEQMNDCKIFYIPIDNKLIYDDNKLNELSAVEDILMVGYPIGMSDVKNNYPIFRRGITSSHPAVSFNENGIGVIDMACFPGSSGSPIFIVNENGYSDKRGNTYLGKSRIVFLGILFAGPTFNTQGEMQIIEIPTKQINVINVPLMVNLGYYIRANEINEFKSIIDEMVKRHPPIPNKEDNDKATNI